MSNLLFTAADLWFIYGLLGVLVALFAAFFVCGLKKCPEDKIMVVFSGGRGVRQPIKCVHGGIIFVLPFIQSYRFLPIETINSELTVKLDERELKIVYAAEISTEPNLMLNAAEKLLDLDKGKIKEICDTLVSSAVIVVKGDDNFKETRIKEEIRKYFSPYGLSLIGIDIKEINL